MTLHIQSDKYHTVVDFFDNGKEKIWKQVRRFIKNMQKHTGEKVRHIEDITYK